MKIANSPIYRYGNITSTMDIARDLIHRFPQHGSTVVANEQSGGKGQYGRRWHSEPGKGLLMTVLLDSNLLDSQSSNHGFSRYSLSTALAICYALRKYLRAELDIAVKWPNDIMINDKKAGGILLETESSWLLVGIGLNFVSQKIVFETSPLPPLAATSLTAETGKAIDQDGLLHNIRIQLDKVYSDSLWYEEVSSLLWGKGRNGTVYFHDNSTVSGIVEDIDKNGVLLLRMDDGKVKKISTGTLRLNSC